MLSAVESGGGDEVGGDWRGVESRVTLKMGTVKTQAEPRERPLAKLRWAAAVDEGSDGGEEEGRWRGGGGGVGLDTFEAQVRIEPRGGT